MARRKTRLRSDIGWSTPDRIGVMGYDLVNELIGRINLGDMGFLEITGRLPNQRESRMFNAMLVTLAEHGIVPSTLATRLTYSGAPESLQAAVAAGLLGLGSVFVGSTEDAARMLLAALPKPGGRSPLATIADRVVADYRARGRPLPGLGHPIHKPVDPRVPRLFTIARATRFSGPYIRLMQLIAKRAEKLHGRALPMNATGAIAAILCEMKLPPQIARGVGVMARAVGLVGHILEESRRPMARELWHRVEAEASAAVRGKLRKKR